ncbi:MAG: glycine cleavage system protein GcvH [Candidatus Dormibacteria bacterium]
MPELDSYRFTRTHEWVCPQGQGEALVGISDHAQSQLGDVIFLELPKVGAQLKAGDRLGAIESVKAASDLYSPASGEVAEVNPALTATPELVNHDPYQAGWLFRLKLEGDLPAGLMDAAAYDSYAQSDPH